ncbi:MAG: sel1 repeat family protein [Henriciella sp.]|nr:sel1 repeat family protein [Henriciella sp.]
MLARLILVLTCIAALPMAATAQFGPEPASPRTAKEIYADRAMKDAASLIRVTPTDIVTSKDGIDLDRAQKWHNQARTRYQELCNERDRRADFWSRNCYKLADIYRRGLGVTQDYNAAKALYMTACLEGQHLNACLQQAYIDHAGNAGETDWPNARKLYEIACNMGDPSGCAGLGNMLYRGQGGPADRKLGATLIQNACADDYEWACERLEGFGLTRRARRF